jgi:two-component system response regulator HydG
MRNTILLVDDDQDHCELLRAMLVRLGYGVTATTSAEEALEHAARDRFSVVVTDLSMAPMTGFELCDRLIAQGCEAPIIAVTGHANMEFAVSALRAGAYDFLAKPVDEKLLGLCVARAAQHLRLQQEVKRLRGDKDLASDGQLIGDSIAMRRVYDTIRRVATSDASVLIQGETGTGKERVARALHAAGPHPDGPFVAINCAALPAGLLESELFGHARSAFTDAKTAKEGLFVRASGGTLFLDEIADMPLEMQSKLLRALEERTVRPIGSNVEVPFETRIVAASHRDLQEEVAARRFREDLLNRINVVQIDVPPLRERTGDVLKLASFFLRRSAERSHNGEMFLPPVVAERLLAYDWPGNVRELENCMEHAVALARFSHLGIDDLPPRLRAQRTGRLMLPADEPGEIVPLDELERRYIVRVVKLLEGNKSRAAHALGLDRRTLHRKLERYASSDAEPDSAERSNGALS